VHQHRLSNSAYTCVGRKLETKTEILGWFLMELNVETGWSWRKGSLLRDEVTV
jgi:hypothetical protein